MAPAFSAVGLGGSVATLTRLLGPSTELLVGAFAFSVTLLVSSRSRIRLISSRKGAVAQVSCNS